MGALFEELIKLVGVPLAWRPRIIDTADTVVAALLVAYKGMMVVERGWRLPSHIVQRHTRLCSLGWHHVRTVGILVQIACSLTSDWYAIQAVLPAIRSFEQIIPGILLQ
ncbi:hypothetical protein TNCV_4829661 [Trichonephila clavipes]|nr:hypothetical protein TNCV_4829661 [Trichonephila clavipes]